MTGHELAALLDLYDCEGGKTHQGAISADVLESLERSGLVYSPSRLFQETEISDKGREAVRAALLSATTVELMA